MPFSKWKTRGAGFLFGSLTAGLLLGGSLWEPPVDRVEVLVNLLEERCVPLAVRAAPPKTADLVEFIGPPPNGYFHDTASGLSLILSKHGCTVSDIFDPLSEVEWQAAVDVSIRAALSSLKGAAFESIWPDENAKGFLQLVAVLDDRHRHPSFLVTRFGPMTGDEMSGKATSFTYNRPTESDVDA